MSSFETLVNIIVELITIRTHLNIWTVELRTKRKIVTSNLLKIFLHQ